MRKVLQQRVQILLERAQRAEGLSGEESNELLNFFFDGLSLDHLRDLLASVHGRVAQDAVWIASELGVKARPLRAQISRLLDSEDFRMRFWALDSMTTALEPGDDEFSLAFRAINDPHPSVVCKALLFASQVPIEVLMTGLDAIACSASPLKVAAEQMASRLRKLNPDDLRLDLDSSDLIVSRCAAAIAARNVRTMPWLIALAGESQDDAIRKLSKYFTPQMEIDAAGSGASTIRH